MEEEKNNQNSMPMGLAFQMSMNERAMEQFSKMTESEKRQVLYSGSVVKTKI